MRIFPIGSFNYVNNKNPSALKTQNKSYPNFKHHPDFIALQKKYDVTASNYFRRGGFYGCASEKFVDVIDTLKLFFSRRMKNNVTMLIGGIAESQEPYSMLAVVKNLIGRKRIREALDLHIIDLQSKPDERRMQWQSFYDQKFQPEYVPESFVREETTDYGFRYQYRYRVKPDIYKYLASVYNNPEKSKWETRIQDGIEDYSDEEFDIISINNTLGYILDYGLMMNTVKEIQKKLKPGGVFITDPHIVDYNEVFSPDICDEIYPGIYQKKHLDIASKAPEIKSCEPIVIHSEDGTDFTVRFR